MKGKVLTVFLVVCILAVSLCGCGLEESDVIGVWEKDGENYPKLIISADGSCMYIKNLLSIKKGTWTIEGGTLYTTYEGELERTVYEKKGDHIITGNIEYFRAE